MDHLLDEQLLYSLANTSKLAAVKKGTLYHQQSGIKRVWQKRFCCLHQNILFEFDDAESLSPSFVIHLEHCNAEVVFCNPEDKEHAFSIAAHNRDMQSFKSHIYMSHDEDDRNMWIKNINNCSYSSMKSAKEELQYRNQHLLHVIESERLSKWQLQDFSEEQRKHLNSLRREMPALISKKVEEALNPDHLKLSDDIKKIRKIQSFIRGVICRRRWHSIVQEYINSPHAEDMRKRNTIVFELVHAESEYVDCLSLLVTKFYQPFKMAASSSNQPVTHEEVNAIFLNSETLMFLHQIFLKGLRTRMDSWPKLVLSDLFGMLLPMLSIYQEYVRNHHYSLQTLSNCKQNGNFRRLLRNLEEKPNLYGQTLENFLTYPMHQIPTYIATLQKLLSLTPPEHVERNSLEHSESVLEELSAIMHDEVSETENIRQNLAIERQLQDGCDLLLDSTEVLIKKGILVEIIAEASFNKMTRKRSIESKESAKQCFLFSKILLITNRSTNGKLTFGKNGKIMLSDITMIEDIIDQETEVIRLPYLKKCRTYAFKLFFTNENFLETQKIILMANSAEEKTAWTNDISQCMENLMAQDLEKDASIESRVGFLSIRSDPRLFTDTNDIKYSSTLDCCRLQRIRYASVERLLERLLDVRFLSVEFLNVFLTTYSEFTTDQVVLDTIIKFYGARRITTKSLITMKGGGSNDSINSQPSAHDSTDHLIALQISSRRHSSPSAHLQENLKVKKRLLKTTGKNYSKRHSLTGGIFEDVKRKFERINRKSELENIPSLDESTDLLPENEEKESTDDVNVKPQKEVKKHRKVTNSMSEGLNGRARFQSSFGMSQQTKVQHSSLQSLHTSNEPPKVSLAKSRSLSNIKSKLVAETGSFRRSNSPDRLSVEKSTGLLLPSAAHCVSTTAVEFAAATACATSSAAASPTTRFRRFRKFCLNDDVPGNIVTYRVLMILKHWVTKKPETFKCDDSEVKPQVESFLLKLIQSSDTVLCERKLASSILKCLATDAHPLHSSPDLTKIVCSRVVTFECVSTVQLARQITLIDHYLLTNVQSREFLSKNWMKDDKNILAGNLLKTIERFNLTSRLVSSEIVIRQSPTTRANVVEKWAMVANTCYCLNNFNAVLAIITAFNSSAVFRLKKTWEKVNKQTKLLIGKLKEVVSADERFRNLRDALKCCDPPCVPYLGFYLSDLAFIEERPTIDKNGLVNFSKIKMVASIIEEIHFYQRVKYDIEENEKVLSYYMNSNVLSEEEIYTLSLEVEQRRSTHPVPPTKTKFFIPNLFTSA